MLIENYVNKVLIKNEIENNIKIENDKFKKDIEESLNNIEKIKEKFTLENIKDISLDEIKNIFKTDEEKALAQNLKLSTMFSKDEKLTKIMYETVLNKPLDLGYHFLKDRYEDKFNFFNTRKSNLADLLHLSITSRLKNQNSTSTTVIEKEKLNLVLEKVYSFDFLSAFSNTSKNQYDRYKDKNSDYSFLYNDYYMQYQEMIHKYKDLESFEKQMLS